MNKLIIMLLTISAIAHAADVLTLTNDVWVTVSGVDADTGKQIGISIIPLSERANVDVDMIEIVLPDGTKGKAMLAGYPKWIMRHDRSTMISFTNQSLDAMVTSFSYEHKKIILSKTETNVVIRLKRELPSK